MTDRPPPLALARRLRGDWDVLVGTSSAAVLAGEDLLARWTAPNRHYHTVHHLASVLDHLQRLGGESPAVRLAAWYHDAEYDPDRPDNEDVSATLAASTLDRLGLQVGLVAEVGRLVRLTATHLPAPGDADGARLCDADLAVLGSPLPEYARYQSAVRAEYGALDEDSWRAGRSRVLSGFLARSHIYATALGRDRWERAARANLAAELASLRSGGPGPSRRRGQP